MMHSTTANSRNLAIRRARLTDIPSINEVHRSAVLAQAAPSYNAAQTAAWARVPLTGQHVEHLVHAILDEFVWVAEQEARVTAYAHARWLPSERTMYLESLYVIPSRTGLGHGSALLRTVEATAILCDAQAVWLHAALTSEAFYARHGYRSEGPHDLLQLGTTSLPRQPMCKQWHELLDHAHAASMEKP